MKPFVWKIDTGRCLLSYSVKICIPIATCMIFAQNNYGNSNYSARSLGHRMHIDSSQMICSCYRECSDIFFIHMRMFIRGYFVSSFSSPSLNKSHACRGLLCMYIVYTTQYFLLLSLLKQVQKGRKRVPNVAHYCSCRSYYLCLRVSAPRNNILCLQFSYSSY